jgi:hypothetical protein
MGIYKQKKGDKGSLKWMQILINNRPDIINLQIQHNFRIPACTEIEWVSPRKEEYYAEYRDEAFLKVLGVSPAESQTDRFLAERWSTMGRFRKVIEWNGPANRGEDPHF